MVNDETVKESDIDVYNQLYQYSRRFTGKTVSSSKSETEKTLEERAFDLLRIMAGESLAERMVCGFKNLCYRIIK